MQKQAIHSWASDVCGRVTRGVRNEDSRVELKAEWIDPKKAARRIAAHANSMRSEPILWIFGIDEKAGLTGLTKTVDPGEWYAAARSVFDGTAPDLGGVVAFNYDGKDLVALQLYTDSAPYVVKNISGAGPIQFEVPWRDGTLTRSAHQRELLQLLLPQQHLPDFEPLEATLIATREGSTTLQWHADVIGFVEPSGRDLVTVPFHRIDLVVKRGDDSDLQLTLSVAMNPVGSYDSGDPLRIRATASEVQIGCPGRVRVSGRGFDPVAAGAADPKLDRRVIVKFRPTHAEFPRVAEITLVPAIDRGSAAGRWVFPAHRRDEPHDKNHPKFHIARPPLEPPRMS